MKIKIRRQANQIGAALLVALVIGSILCISVVGYLSVTEQQTLLSARSQAWNMAITVVEAGIEEGLQHANNNFGNLGIDGWTVNGPYYTRTRTLADGISYIVTIDASLPTNPTIESRADVKAPTFVQRRGTAFFAAAGVNTEPTPTAVARAVRVRTQRGSLFTKAMAARRSIDLNGNNIATDSFDSADPYKSNWGKYDPAVYRGDKGDVASNDTIVNSVDIGNANIYGRVATGPGGSVAIGSQGAIGSHTWQAAGNKGKQTGWVTDDSNFTLPQTDLPYTSGTALGGPGDFATVTYNVSTNAVTSSSTYPNPVPWSGVTTNIASWSSLSSVPAPPLPYGFTTNYYWVSNTTIYPSPSITLSSPVITNWNQAHSGKIYTYQYLDHFSYPNLAYSYSLYNTNAVWTTNHYDHVINAQGDYYVTSLTGSTLVNATGVRLVVANGLNMGGSDSITIAYGANISLYAGGTSCSVTTENVKNKGGFAGSFVLYCAPSVTSFALNGNADFLGVLVAPNVDISMNGGGNSDYDFVGALIVKSVTLNGHYKFHYDEALSRMANNPRLLIASWDEITPH